MTDQNLITYVKQNLTKGFSETEIRSALRQVGWKEEDIAQAFGMAKNSPQAQHRAGGFETSKSPKKVITALTVLVLFPILGIASFFLYQNFGPRGGANGPAVEPPEGSVSGELTASEDTDPAAMAQRQARDQQRLADIANIQDALEKYFERYQTYPQKLSDLENEKLMASVPHDPEKGDPYLYTSFGDPALHYSLAWILETEIGTLPEGLHTASSENIIPVQNYLNQQSVVLGEIEQVSEELTITELSIIPFYPREEVTLEINNPTGKAFVSAILKFENSYINLTDTKSPFRFRFSAPPDSGQYHINVHAFDEQGNSYSQKTSLTVK